MSGENDRYPLRCRPAEWEGGSDGWELHLFGETRCRQVSASELGLDIGAHLRDLAGLLDDELHKGAVGETWGPYGNEMVVVREGASAAFAEFLNEWMDVHAHVNEGDEQ